MKERGPESCKGASKLNSKIRRRSGSEENQSESSIGMKSGVYLFISNIFKEILGSQLVPHVNGRHGRKVRATSLKRRLGDVSLVAGANANKRKERHSQQ